MVLLTTNAAFITIANFAAFIMERTSQKGNETKVSACFGDHAMQQELVSQMLMRQYSDDEIQGVFIGD